MYSGEYDACDVTLSVYPHRASLKNMPDHGGNRTYDLWNTSPMLCQKTSNVYVCLHVNCSILNIFRKLFFAYERFILKLSKYVKQQKIYVLVFWTFYGVL